MLLPYCPSSNKWNRRSNFLMESFVPHFQFTRRVSDSASDEEAVEYGQQGGLIRLEPLVVKRLAEK